MNKRLMRISRTNTLFRVSIAAILVEFIAELILMIYNRKISGTEIMKSICKKGMMILVLLFLAYIQFLTQIKVMEIFEYTFIFSEIINLIDILKNLNIPLPKLKKKKNNK